MTHKIHSIILLIIIIFASCAQKKISLELQQLYIGAWEGVLELPGQKLPIVFHIQYDQKRFKAKMDSPSQGVMGIPMDKVIINDTKIIILNAAMNMNFKGTLNDKDIKGSIKQSGQNFSLVLKKTVTPTTLNRPQEPKPPFHYDIEDVTFKNNKDNIKLGGTLCYPKSGGPFRAAVLITGSGAQNRDEEVFGHKPFLVIADHLCRQGFAVLRYDDRGFGESEGNFHASTSRDFAQDAESAMDFLKTKEFIHKDKIGLIGHSEGGLICSMIASKRSDTAFIIMLAGPSLPGDELLLQQSQAIMEASGDKLEDINKIIEANKKIYQIIKEDSREARKRVSDILSQSGVRGPQHKTQMNVLFSPWLKVFINSDPAVFLERVRIPVLALFGKKDLQVPYKTNAAALEKALKKAGNRDFLIYSLDNLNHLFQSAETGLVDEYPTIEETINPEVLDILSQWLKQRI